MNTHADKTKKKNSQSDSNPVTHDQTGYTSASPLVDNRSGPVQMRQLIGRASNHSDNTTFYFADNRPEVVDQQQLQEIADSKAVVQRMRNFGGTGSNGPYQQGWGDWVKEKAHGAAVATVNYVRNHPAALASTGVEIATHTVDVLALRTVMNELSGALSGVGEDISHADLWSLVDRCVDASAAAIRGGASVATVTHGWGEATGIPLAGDVAWYGSAALRDQIKATIRPHMLKSINYKRKIGKLD